MKQANVPEWAKAAVIERPLPSGNPERAAIVAHYSASHVATRSVSALLHELAACGYQSVVVSTCPSPEPLEWPHGLPEGVGVVRRDNLGYDFGSWGVGLELYQAARWARYTILTNDSMAGPFGPLDDVIFDFEMDGADIWGITSSDQIAPHLQSYFLGFANKTLSEVPWRLFFQGIRHHEEKMEYVLRYELSTLRLAVERGFTWNVRHAPAELGVGELNPTLFGWKELLELGVPLVKRTILKEPGVAPEGYTISDEVRRLYGAELNEWVEEAACVESQ